MTTPAESFWRMAYHARQEAFKARAKILEYGLEALHYESPLPPDLHERLRKILDTLGDPDNEVRLEELYQDYLPTKEEKQIELEGLLKRTEDEEEQQQIITLHLRWEDLAETLHRMRLEHHVIIEWDNTARDLDKTGDDLAESGQ